MPGLSSALSELRRACPDAIIAGCSSAGEILGREVHDQSLCVAVVRFEGTELALAEAENPLAEGSEDTGRRLAERLRRPDLRAVLVLADGLTVNGTALTRGFNTALDDVVVTGGLAGDGDLFEQTWTFDGERRRSGRVVAVGLYGDRVSVSAGSRGGWTSFGPHRLVTRSRGNVLYELDGRPALALYKRYLGRRAAGLPASGLLFPLSIRPEDGSREPLVRTILAVDEAAQSLTFAGDVPQGWKARLMRANPEQLIEGSARAARDAAPRSEGRSLALAISCVGRRLVLGQRADEECEAILECLGSNVRQLGFYSYGEIAPSRPSHRSDLHNQTMTVTVLNERAAP